MEIYIYICIYIYIYTHTHTHKYMPCLIKHRESLFYHSVGALAKLRKAIISFVMSVCPPALLSISVCPHGKNLAHTGQIFMKFRIWLFLENLWRNFRRHWNLTRIKDTLQEDFCSFAITSHWILLIRKVSDKRFRDNQNQHFMFDNFFPKIMLFMR